MMFHNNNSKPFVPETLEDIVEVISHNIHVKVPVIDKTTGKRIYLGMDIPYDQTFISDISLKIFNGKSLSERQAHVVWKIVKKYLDFIAACNIDLDALLKLIEHPKYRRPLYKSILIPREIRYIGNSKFVVRFNYNPTVKSDLQSSVTECKWNDANKFWIIALAKNNYNAFLRFIRKHKFELDVITSEMLNYMVSLDQGYEIGEKNDRIFVNVVDNQGLYNLLNMVWQENYETF